MLLPIIVALMLCSPLPTQAEQKSSEPTKWTTLENERYGYRFVLPTGWNTAGVTARDQRAWVGRLEKRQELLWLATRPSKAGADYIAVIATRMPREVIEDASALREKAMRSWIRRHPNIKPRKGRCLNYLSGGFSTGDVSCFTTTTPSKRWIRLAFGTTYGYRPTPALIEIVTSFSSEEAFLDPPDVAVGPLPDWRSADAKLTGNCPYPPAKNCCELVPRCPLSVRGDVIVVEPDDPLYPEDARKRDIWGRVTLAARVNGEGKLVDLRVVEGNRSLVPAAIKAVTQYEYKPYVFMGEGRDFETTMEVRFTPPNVRPWPGAPGSRD